MGWVLNRLLIALSSNRSRRRINWIEHDTTITHKLSNYRFFIVLRYVEYVPTVLSNTDYVISRYYSNKTSDTSKQ